MSKIYARQVPPEWQESNFDLDMQDGFYESIAIFGNRDFLPCFADDIKFVKDAIDKDLPEMTAEYLADKKAAAEYYGYSCLSEMLNYELPRADGKNYSTKQVAELGRVLANYYDEQDREPFLRVLEIVTGHVWERRTICGCRQREWNNLYYDAEKYKLADVEGIETRYFNTGSEWEIFDDYDPEDENADPDDEPAEVFNVYCISWDEDDLKKEIASCCFGDPDDVILYQFSGFTRTPTYSKV